MECFGRPTGSSPEGGGLAEELEPVLGADQGSQHGRGVRSKLGRQRSKVGIPNTDVSIMWLILTDVLLGLVGYSPGGRCKLGSTHPPCLPIRTQIVLLVVTFRSNGPDPLVGLPLGTFLSRFQTRGGVPNISPRRSSSVS